MRIVGIITNELYEGTFLSDEALEELKKDLKGFPITIGGVKLGHVDFNTVVNGSVMFEGELDMEVFPSGFILEEEHDPETNIRTITKYKLTEISIGL